MIQEERFWAPFAEAIDLPILTEDARFAVTAERRRHTREAVELIEQRIAEEPRDHWAAIFDALDFPWAPAADELEISQDPQAAVNGYVGVMEHRSGIEFKVLGAPFKLDQAPMTNYSSAPSSANTPNSSSKSWATTGTPSQPSSRPARSPNRTTGQQ